MENKSKHKSIISLGYYSFHHIYIFLGILTWVGRKYVRKRFEEVNEFDVSPLIKLLILFIGQALDGFVIFIEKYKTKRENRKETVVNIKTYNLLNDIYKDNSKIIKLKAYLALISLPVLDILKDIINAVCRDKNCYGNTLIQLGCIAEFLGICFFMRVVLQMHYYLHYFIYLILMITGILLYGLSSIDLDLDKFDSVLCFILFLISYFLYGLENVSEKFLMDLRFISPFKILMFEGLIGIFLIALMSVIFSFIPCAKEGNRFIMCVENSKKIFEFHWFVDCFKTNERILWFIISIFANFAFLIFYILTIEYYTPAHCYIFITVGDLMSTLIECFISETKSYYAILIIGGFLHISGSLLFNEIFVINLFGLSENTRSEIEKRSILITKKDIDELESYNADRISALNE